MSLVALRLVAARKVRRRVTVPGCWQFVGRGGEVRHSGTQEELSESEPELEEVLEEEEEDKVSPVDSSWVSLPSSSCSLAMRDASR